MLVKGRVLSREMEPVCGEPYHARYFVRTSAWVISTDICFDRFHFALLLFYKVYEGLKYTHNQFNVLFKVYLQIPFNKMIWSVLKKIYKTIWSVLKKI